VASLLCFGTEEIWKLIFQEKAIDKIMYKKITY